MIVLVVAILAAVTLFGTGAARVALTDLALLETQEAAQRAAEAAAGRAADLLVPGTNTPAQIDAQTSTEVTDIATANLIRGAFVSADVLRTSSPSEFVRVSVTLRSTYGGIIGPVELTATGTASVPRTAP
ncbi:MAG: hypothetical protein AUH85_18315 [Chloroflexi bacterium 13_1_40CM_4_68_4]|nr:MAG: hypothetical protein AUH85_18315 [Chloroflexi bacterium 13_1_40CM_4_68_4]